MRAISFGRGSSMGAAVVLMLSILVAPAVVRAVDVSDVLSRMQQALGSGKDMRAIFTLEMSNASAEIVRWAGAYYRRGGPDPRARLVFESPLDLRGTDVSVRRGTDGTNHVRVYLPGLRRVREIDGDMRGEAFMGTDFNYEDLGFHQLEYQQHSLLGEVEQGGRDCYQLESVPQRGWWYGRIVRYIDKKTFLPLRTEYYDRGNVLWKVRTVDEVKTIASFATPTSITMRTLPTGTSTRITLSEVQYNTGLADVLFEGP